MKNISKAIGQPPAMNTRLRDSIDVPSLETVIKAYGAIRNPLLTSETKENSFQTLNTVELYGQTIKLSNPK